MLKLLYFAGAREAVGLAEEWLAVPAEVVTVGALARFLETRHPNLLGRLAGVRFAVNETFATNDTALADGDVVAVIPPVSGG